jgi:hypothetical protein
LREPAAPLSNWRVGSKRPPRFVGDFRASALSFLNLAPMATAAIRLDYTEP